MNSHYIPLIVLSFFTVLFAGCATLSDASKNELVNADYGSAISQSDAEIKSMSFLKQYLKDPDSAKVYWNKVSKVYWKQNIFCKFNCKHEFGYSLKALVNARNGFGGYSGKKNFEFMFFNGSLVTVYAENPDGYMLRVY